MKSGIQRIATEAVAVALLAALGLGAGLVLVDRVRAGAITRPPAVNEVDLFSTTHELVIARANGERAVTIDLDKGTVALGPGMEPNDAALEFWSAVRKIAHTMRGDPPCDRPHSIPGEMLLDEAGRGELALSARCIGSDATGPANLRVVMVGAAHVVMVGAAHHRALFDCYPEIVRASTRTTLRVDEK